ncbi:hypothetical protein P152DRAFT_87563 [Eremomyces bilateralis CBS 781.70]|uniref:WIBG Mago-binding domain-containing protein n=1 Tax=Eremomyces bilateralis CBS 781.70 TaxID=1392243 RepID=A0A6G1FYI4_9PEZI|nr:uncharacterized protein P152DRAFT_87563 [Eremomyces bilateralis CBS 781.70]KAF1810907.1 hypothetical protein P152DRAFT_87563 [Eremomyces bilateralis CBS 781.70]
MPPPTNPSKSGITTDRAGTSVIPSSVRPDGTVRKEIKVRPGYRPPEDVEVYKNRTAEAWKNRYAGGVPGAEAVGAEREGKAGKNAKRRERRKAAAAAGGSDAGGEDTATATATTEPVVVAGSGETATAPEPSAADAKEKEARKIAKKLRQARELRAKKDQGDSLLPEQVAKVIKIQELVRQLDALGFDANAERKGESAG